MTEVDKVEMTFRSFSLFMKWISRPFNSKENQNKIKFLPNSFAFRHVLRVSIWNDVLTGSNRTVGEVDVVLADIDWSKESICDYTLKLS